MNQTTQRQGRTGLAVADFLLDRLDEDWEAAWGAAPSPWSYGEGGGKILDRYGDITAVSAYGGTTGHILHFDPTAIIKRIESARLVVERCARIDYLMPSTPLAHGILWELAQAYRGHPDFREEWAA